MGGRSIDMLVDEDSIKRNTLLGIFIALSRYVFPIVTYPYITRVLHPEGLGLVSFIASFATYFILVAQLGMPIYGLRSCAFVKNNRKRLNRLVGELFLVHVLLVLVTLCLYGIIVNLLLPLKNEPVLFFIYSFNIFACMADYEWVYKATGKFSFLALVNGFFRFAAILAVFLFVREKADLYRYATISVMANTGALLTGFLSLRKQLGITPFRDLIRIITNHEIVRVLCRHLRPLLLFFLLSCAGVIYSHTDTVMLGFMKDNSLVGIYNVSAKVKALLIVLTGALWTAALPRSAEFWDKGDTQDFCELAEQSFRVVSTVSLPLVVFFILFAEPCIRIIAGEEYLSAVLPMRILLIAVLSIGVSNIIGGQMLIPIGQERLLFRAELWGVLSNITVNMILIPLYGVMGAAVATVLTETLITMATVVYIRQFVQLKIFEKYNLIRSVLACFIAAATVCSIPLPLYPLFQLISAFLIYGFIFILVMILSGDYCVQKIIKSTVKSVCPASFYSFARRVWRFLIFLQYTAEAVMFASRGVYCCPCCGLKLKSFRAEEFGNNPELRDPKRYVHTRQDVICPFCHSLPRHRILAFWCTQNLNTLRGKHILYFAPEDSMMMWLKRNEIMVITADFFNKADLKLDMDAIDQPDASWDLVFCNHVLEHVPNYRRALCELRRILKPGGRLICSFPIDQGYETVQEDTTLVGIDTLEADRERVRKFGQIDHLRIFGRDSVELLESAGFIVSVIDGNKVPESFLPVVGPADYDSNQLFVCEKICNDVSTEKLT